MSALTGPEITRLLTAACEDAGLDRHAASRVLAAFAVRWGEQVMADLDTAMWDEELGNDGKEAPR